jgi:hypothetical protein
MPQTESSRRFEWRIKHKKKSCEANRFSLLSPPLGPSEMKWRISCSLSKANGKAKAPPLGPSKTKLRIFLFMFKSARFSLLLPQGPSETKWRIFLFTFKSKYKCKKEARHFSVEQKKN